MICFISPVDQTSQRLVPILFRFFYLQDLLYYLACGGEGRPVFEQNESNRGRFCGFLSTSELFSCLFTVLSYTSNTLNCCTFSYLSAPNFNVIFSLYPCALSSISSFLLSIICISPRYHFFCSDDHVSLWLLRTGRVWFIYYTLGLLYHLLHSKPSINAYWINFNLYWFTKSYWNGNHYIYHLITNLKKLCLEVCRSVNDFFP